MEFFLHNYRKFRWFYSRSGKLVVGGKNARQNDELLQQLQKEERDYWVLHTCAPGSPFSVILSPTIEVSAKDLKEAAIFTACFSRAWRSKSESAVIDIFKKSSIYKDSSMAQGTWGVRKKEFSLKVSLQLSLTMQQNTLRAIPLPSLHSKKESLAIITPGSKDKQSILYTLQRKMPSITNEEILSALPAGGISVNGRS